MRRKDREMNERFALAVVDKCEYAVLSVTPLDQTPYCVPISIVRIEDAVYFHCARDGKKTDALRQNPRVCVACVGDTHRMEDEFSTEYESAILFGNASEVTDEAEKVSALRRLCERHTPLNMDAFDREIKRSLFKTAVWRITIDMISGKRKKYDENGKEIKSGRIE